MFFSFLRFFILQNNKKAHVSASKETLTHKNCQKGCPKASKMGIFVKKMSFSTKKACKINTYASKRLKYGSKRSQESTLDHP